MVGDTDIATVQDLAARYIGTLPAGEPDDFVNRRPDFPRGNQRLTIGVDAASGAEGFDIAFGTQMDVTTAALVTADVAEAVINDLLVSRVREALGDAYVANVAVGVDDAIGYWEGRISVTGATEGQEAGHAEVMEILTELIADGPTERDLDQAIAVVEADYAFTSNAQIIAPLLRRRYVDDSQAASPNQRSEALGQVTSDDVQQFIADLFDTRDRIEVFRSVDPQ